MFLKSLLLSMVFASFQTNNILQPLSPLLLLGINQLEKLEAAKAA